MKQASSRENVNVVTLRDRNFTPDVIGTGCGRLRSSASHGTDDVSSRSSARREFARPERTFGVAVSSSDRDQASGRGNRVAVGIEAQRDGVAQLSEDELRRRVGKTQSTPAYTSSLD